MASLQALQQVMRGVRFIMGKARLWQHDLEQTAAGDLWSMLCKKSPPTGGICPQHQTATNLQPDISYAMRGEMQQGVPN